MAAKKLGLKKRSGTDMTHGKEFELQLICLTYLRCLKMYKNKDKKLKSFWVDSNIDHVGAFDDVVCRIEYEHNKELVNKLIFVQLKHREDPTKNKFSDGSLLGSDRQENNLVKSDDEQKGEQCSSRGQKRRIGEQSQYGRERGKKKFAEIVKYIASYLQIRNIFDESEQCEMFAENLASEEYRKTMFEIFNCKLTDSFFIFYTNAEKSEAIKCFEQIQDTDIVTEIFDTSFNSGIHKMKIEKKKLNEIMKEKYKNLNKDEIERVNKFNHNFMVYTDQDKEHELKHEIKKFIESLLEDKTSSVDIDLLYDKLKDEIQECVKTDLDHPISEKNNFVKKIFFLEELQNQTNGVKEKYNYWSESKLIKDEIVDNLYCILKNRKSLKISCNADTKTKSLVTCLQLFDKMNEENKSHTTENQCSDKNKEGYMENRKNEKSEKEGVLFLFIKNESFERWKSVRNLYHYTKHSAVLVCIEKNVSLDDINHVRSSEARTQEFIILISDCNFVFDHDLRKQLSDTGIKKILNTKVTFQGVAATLREVLGNTEIEEIFQYTRYRKAPNVLLSLVLKNEKVSIGNSVPEMEKIYIDRQYKKHSTPLKLIGTKEQEEEIYMNEEKFLQQSMTKNCTVISDNVGMGKSTALKHMSHCIKNTYKEHWIEYIKLIYQETKIKKLKGCFTPIEAVISLLKLNDIEKMIFQHKCNTDGKVVLLFDGFDEICQESRTICVRLFKALSETKIQAIFIATRPNVVKELSNCLLTNHFHIDGFNYDDINKYLMESWTQQIQIENIDILKNIVGEIIEQVKEMKEVLSDIVEVPLQTKMLAETYVDDVKQTLYSKESSFILTQLNFYTLYNNFITMHIDRCCKQKYEMSDKNNRSKYENVRDELFKKDSGSWEAIACQELFPTEKLCKTTASDISNLAKQSIGIFNWDTDLKTFVHRSFAEFLAAKHISRLIYGSQDITKLNFIYQTVCIDNVCIVVRKFMNAFFENENDWKTAKVNSDFEIEAELDVLVTTIFEKNEFLFRAILRHLSKNVLERLFKHKTALNESLLHLSAKYCENVFDDILDNEHFGSEMCLCVDSDGKTALHVACCEGKEKAVKSYLSKNNLRSAVINQADNEKKTPLLLAAQEGHNDIIKTLLLNHKVPIHSKNEDGVNSLMLSSEFGRTKTVKYLLEQDAQIDDTDKGGKTALMYAAKYDKNISTLKYLIDQKANIKATDSDGTTAIMLAAKHGAIKVVKYLIEKDVEVAAAKDVNGKTAFMFAAIYGHKTIVDYLLTCPSCVANGVDFNGNTCLILCSGTSENSVMLQCLLEIESNIDKQNKDGDTALIKAVSKGKFENLKFLIAEGANVNIVNNEKDSALIVLTKQDYANNEISRNNYDIMKHLLESGADVDQKNCEGNSALYYAGKRNNRAMVELLKDYVAK